MKKEAANKLRSPKDLSELTLEIINEKNGKIIEGKLIAQNGEIFPVKNGIIDFSNREHLEDSAIFARDYYTKIAHSYDENLHITFDLYNEEEADIRNNMIELLHLKKESKVLEVSAGTGKDSEIIASKLGKDGHLSLLDITPSMIEIASKRLGGVDVPYECIIGTACALPFADNSFDALYCFAGIGHFPDIKKGLSEMSRVVKPGGRVVFCEKNVPTWLRNTEYGKILINNNPMFAYEAPLAFIPTNARNVGIRWINGNVHYVVDYTVGVGEPKGNFDLELPGERGGTFNTRYYGKLEGITKEAKEMAEKARDKLGISMHKWLDTIVKEEAKKILNKK